MGRHKGKLIPKYIDNNKVRKTTFKNRCANLKKKVREFSTLCDVDACLISFGRDGELEIWPEEEPSLRRVIQRYESVKSEQKEMHKVTLASYNNINTQASGWELAEALNCKIEKVTERMEFLKNSPGGDLQDQFQRQDLCLPALEYSDNSVCSEWSIEALEKLLEGPELDHQFGNVEVMPEHTFNVADEPPIFGQSCDPVCHLSYFQDMAEYMELPPSF